MTVYVASTRRGLALGGTAWHIARHTPTGYGVHSLCGRAWDEGDYRTATHGLRIDGPICGTCRRMDAA